MGQAVGVEHDQVRAPSKLGEGGSAISPGALTTPGGVGDYASWPRSGGASAPVELHRMLGSGTLLCGLYRLELWDKPLGKVLHLAWNTVGAVPTIVAFRRGQWEQRLLDLPR